MFRPNSPALLVSEHSEESEDVHEKLHPMHYVLVACTLE